MSDREKTKEPEVVPDLPEKQESRSPERVGVLGGTVWSSRRKRRVAEANLETAKVTTELGRAMIGLRRVQEEALNIQDILDGDNAERKARKVERRNALAKAEREAKAREQIDHIEQKKRELELAEIEAKIANTRTPPQPRTEADKVRADFDKHFAKEAAIRAEAQRRIEEVLRRHGGEITPEAAIEIKNINDYAQQKIDEL